MLELDKLSKYYSSEGIVTTGLEKVSLKLDIGEFVAITGESGSGKSTLLNVISGIDSYEEGEMLISSEPTSGYSLEEMEDFRKTYISNIFQSFNLVTSYTVYQNIELVLLMRGKKKSEIKEQVESIVEKVGLTEYLKTKTSKLSGGQKQRVAIARALAMETPVIVADEPTGNLDRVSADSVIRLLKDLSKDKLIIVVTHNYEQVEEYVTRKITMHDGRIIEDKEVKPADKVKDIKVPVAGHISKDNMAGLGTRNAFNIPSKFILLLVVFLFMCAGTISIYSSVIAGNDQSSGYNMFFNDMDKTRIILTKENKKEFTSKDIKELKNEEHVSKVVEDDIMIDLSVCIEKKDLYETMGIKEFDNANSRLESGRMPKADNEAILFIERDGWMENNAQPLMKGYVKLNDNSSGYSIINNLKITGYAYLTDEEVQDMYKESGYISGYLMTSKKASKVIREAKLRNCCTVEYDFDGNLFTSNEYTLKRFSKVPEGYVYIPESMAAFSEESVVGKSIKIKNESIYFKDSKTLKVKAYLTSDNFKTYLGKNGYNDNSETVFISNKDYSKMYSKGSFQACVYTDDELITQQVAEKLQDKGYRTFMMKDGIVSYTEEIDAFTKLFKLSIMIVVLFVLFFISYFIIRIIMKSRNSYYSIIRMLGAARTECRNIICSELVVIFNIAYAVCLALAIMIANKVITVSDYAYGMMARLSGGDYVILYVILLLMSIFIAMRYSKKLFKKSAMNTFKEEV